MDIGAIAAASIDMHLAETQQAVGIAVTKKVMAAQETQAAALIEQMNSVPSFGHKLDVTI